MPSSFTLDKAGVGGGAGPNLRPENTAPHPPPQQAQAQKAACVQRVYMFEALNSAKSPQRKVWSNRLPLAFAKGKAGRAGRAPLVTQTVCIIYPG